jgi:hypothetical protein
MNTALSRAKKALKHLQQKEKSKNKNKTSPTGKHSRRRQPGRIAHVLPRSGLKLVYKTKPHRTESTKRNTTIINALPDGDTDCLENYPPLRSMEEKEVTNFESSLSNSMENIELDYDEDNDELSNDAAEEETTNRQEQGRKGIPVNIAIEQRANPQHTRQEKNTISTSGEKNRGSHNEDRVQPRILTSTTSKLSSDATKTAITTIKPRAQGATPNSLHIESERVRGHNDEDSYVRPERRQYDEYSIDRHNTGIKGRQYDEGSIARREHSTSHLTHNAQEATKTASYEQRKNGAPTKSYFRSYENRGEHSYYDEHVEQRGTPLDYVRRERENSFLQNQERYSDNKQGRAPSQFKAREMTTHQPEDLRALLLRLETLEERNTTTAISNRLSNQSGQRGASRDYSVSRERMSTRSSMNDSPTPALHLPDKQRESRKEEGMGHTPYKDREWVMERIIHWDNCLAEEYSQPDPDEQWLKKCAERAEFFGQQLRGLQQTHVLRNGNEEDRTVKKHGDTTPKPTRLTVKEFLNQKRGESNEDRLTPKGVQLRVQDLSNSGNLTFNKTLESSTNGSMLMNKRNQPFKTIDVAKLPVPTGFAGRPVGNAKANALLNTMTAPMYVEKLKEYYDIICGQSEDGEIPPHQQKLMIAAVIASWESERKATIKTIGGTNHEVPEQTCIQKISALLKRRGDTGFEELSRFEDLVRIIGEEYISEEQAERALRSFRNKVQLDDETLADYTSNFCSLEEKAKKLNPESMPQEIVIIKQYIDGLHNTNIELRRTLRSKRFVDFAAVLRHMQVILASSDGNSKPSDTLLLNPPFSEQKSPMGENGKKLSIMSRLVRQESQPYKSGLQTEREAKRFKTEAPVLRRIPPGNNPFQHLTQEERDETWNVREYRKFSGTCTRCGENGHNTFISSEGDKPCPLRKDDISQCYANKHDIAGGYSNAINYTKKLKALPDGLLRTSRDPRNPQAPRYSPPSRLKANSKKRSEDTGEDGWENSEENE